MQIHEPRKGLGRLLFVYLWIIFDRLYQPEISLIRGVILEHVQDKSLFDGLPHTVEMEG